MKIIRTKIIAASLGLLCLSVSQARAEDFSQVWFQIKQMVVPPAQELKKKMAASAKKTPATPQLPNQTVEDDLKQNGVIFINNPNIDETPFLAIDGDNLNANREEQVKIETDRAKQLCKFLLGHTATPVVVEIKRVWGNTSALVIGNDGDATPIPSQASSHCTNGEERDENDVNHPSCWLRADIYRSIVNPEVFSRIGCKK
jgi:hypothetical protein